MKLCDECGRRHPPCNVLHTSCGHDPECRHHDQSGCTCDTSLSRMLAEALGSAEKRDKRRPRLTVIQGGKS